MVGGQIKFSRIHWKCFNFLTTMNPIFKKVNKPQVEKNKVENYN